MMVNECFLAVWLAQRYGSRRVVRGSVSRRHFRSFRSFLARPFALASRTRGLGLVMREIFCLFSRETVMNELDFWAHHRVVRRGRWVCWEWTGAKKPNGYGQVKIDGRMWLARRHAYSLSALVPSSRVFSSVIIATLPCAFVPLICFSAGLRKT